MKRIVFLGLVVFGILSIAALSVSLFLLVNLDSLGRGRTDSAPPKYLFAFYIPRTESRYFQDIIKGAELAAKEYQAVLLYHSVDPLDNEIQQAPFLEVNGFVICPNTEDPVIISKIGQIQNKKNHVIVINHSVRTDKPAPFIGFNNFDVGKKMAHIVKQAEQTISHIAIVYSQKNPGIYADRELVELGIRTELQVQGLVTLERFETSLNPLDAEALIDRLIKEYPQVQQVIFTDSSDTIAAAQALIDMNAVGSIQLVGFGNDQTIREYIRKGVIAASVVIHPEKVGYQAVKSLVELVTVGFTSATVDTGVEILEKSSL